jgi:hypothetical protein
MFEKARKIAHRYTPRCKGTKRREHSEACVSLTKEIHAALGAAYDEGKSAGTFLSGLTASGFNLVQPRPRKCSTCDTEHDLMMACPGCGGGPAPVAGNSWDYPYWGMTRKQVLQAKRKQSK